MHVDVDVDVEVNFCVNVSGQFGHLATKGYGKDVNELCDVVREVLDCVPLHEGEQGGQQDQKRFS